VLALHDGGRLRRPAFGGSFLLLASFHIIGLSLCLFLPFALVTLPTNRQSIDWSHVGFLAGIRHPHHFISDAIRLLFVHIAGLTDAQLRLHQATSRPIACVVLQSDDRVR
jgi:hypothetical protein